MSRIQKFEASAEWRNELKKFLLMERDFAPRREITYEESRRYSRDLDPDFLAILEEKKLKKKEQQTINKTDAVKTPTKTMYQAEDKENQATDFNTKMQKQQQQTPNSVKFTYCNDTLLVEDQHTSQWQRTSDESFEIMERMCNKTASDPNSTLFQYLHKQPDSVKCVTLQEQQYIIAEEEAQEEKEKYEKHQLNVAEKNHKMQQQIEELLLQQWDKTSDESFEVMERMCDKTASDPNSTLFEYLHSEQKETVIELAKKRSGSGGKDTFQKATDVAPNVQRLLDQLRIDNHNALLENESPLKGIDVTQLDDVEAPSRLWENTIAGETMMLQTSPVKMVGLLRPSTIIEDDDENSCCSNNNTNNGSNNTNNCSNNTTNNSTSNTTEHSARVSYQTAIKETLASDVSSSCYETANESTSTNRTDELFGTAASLLAKTNFFEDLSIPSIHITAPMEQSVADCTKEILHEVSQRLNELEETDLIDLERTFGALHRSPHSSILIKDDEDDDEDDDNEEAIAVDTNKVDAATAPVVIDDDDVIIVAVEAATPAQMTTQAEAADDTSSDDSVIEILSDEDEDADDDDNDVSLVRPVVVASQADEIKAENVSTLLPVVSPARSRSPDLDDYKENSQTGGMLDQSAASNSDSMQFNDTMEEVEYMMRKGMKYLEANSNAAVKAPATPVTLIATPTKKVATPTPAPKPSPLKIKQHTFLLSPKNESRYRSPSPMLHKQKPMMMSSMEKAKLTNSSSKSASKPLAKPKPINMFSKEMKPFPKLDLFKKPQVSNVPAKTVPTQLRHKQLAAGTQFSHIVSPIRAYIKTSTNTPLMSTINDVHKGPNSLRELEAENRLYKQNFDDMSSVKLSGLSAGAKTLPKKAYISSELKHIVDERTPVTIPGGKQYHKHIETALMPAVLRHEGKLKMPGMTSTSSSLPRKQQPSKMSTSAADTSVTAANASHIPRPADASLANLSLMSGDVSMYTLMDARKF